MFKLIFTKTYELRAKRFLQRHPEVQGQYKKVLELLELNPFHPSLRLHKVTTNGEEIYSVSINISYRITLDFYFDEKKIILINIGSHDQVYR